MSSGCNAFRPNFWRPNSCANCYKHRSGHLAAKGGNCAAEMEKKSNPHKKKELALSGGSSGDVPINVEAVRPYAVVRIAQGQEPERASAQRNSRRWPARASALLSRLKPSGGIRRRNMTSPPPPSARQLRAARAVPASGNPAASPRLPETLTTTTAVEVTRRSFSTQKSNTLPNNAQLVSERAECSARSPPEKPPRTLSTFLTETERDAYFKYANLPCNEIAAESTVQLQAQAVESLQRAPATAAVPSRAREIVPTGEHGEQYTDGGQQTADLVAATLRGIATEGSEQLCCPENLWKHSDWSWVQRVAGSKIAYKGTTLTVEEVTQPFFGLEGELEVCHSLLPHPHLRLVRGQLEATPPSLLHHPSTTSYYLKDHGDAFPLSYLLLEQKQLLTSEAYLHLVLTCLAQVLTAVSHLHSRGICHRNVTMDTLYASPHGTEWLVAVGELHRAVHRAGSPITEQTHVYSMEDLKWSNVSVIPPETLTHPSRSKDSTSDSNTRSPKSIDCCLADAFAVGCLVYCMMGEPHPFEHSPQLLTLDYAPQDLPTFVTDPNSIRSVTLLWLAQQFLARDPRSRMTVRMGLVLCQALLWLPPEWFQEPVPARALQHYLSYEQVAMVCGLAKQKSTTLGNLLKMSFLLDTSVGDLLHSLSVVWKH